MATTIESISATLASFAAQLRAETALIEQVQSNWERLDPHERGSRPIASLLMLQTRISRGLRDLSMATSPDRVRIITETLLQRVPTLNGNPPEWCAYWKTNAPRVLRQSEPATNAVLTLSQLPDVPKLTPAQWSLIFAKAFTTSDDWES